MRAALLKPAANLFGVGAVIEPGQVGVDQRPRGFAGGQRDRHRAPKIRLEPRLDRSLGDSTCGLDRLRVFEDAARHLDGQFERTSKGLSALALRGLDDAGERVGVPLDQPHALLPDAAQPPRGAGLMDQLLKERGCQRGAERSDAASPDPGTATGNLL